jgi:hypothetical protein
MLPVRVGSGTHGGVAEWRLQRLAKPSCPCGTQGSSPCPSALEGGATWVATSLENWAVGNCEGSTPSPSARAGVDELGKSPLFQSGHVAGSSPVAGTHARPCGVTEARLVLSQTAGVQLSAGLPTGWGVMVMHLRFGTVWTGFDSPLPDQCQAARPAEQRPVKAMVVGSRPTLAAMTRWPSG